MNMQAQILEKNGRKEFVVIPYEEYLRMEEMLEDYEDLRDLREAKAATYGEPTLSLQQVRESLESD